MISRTLNELTSEAEYIKDKNQDRQQSGYLDSCLFILLVIPSELNGVLESLQTIGYKLPLLIIINLSIRFAKKMKGVSL